MATKVFIDGEHGTTGLQIRTRLAARFDIDVLSVPQTQRRDADLRRERLNEADVAILCLPDDAARESVAMLEGNNSTRVIDTSTANRVNPDWTYGFAEMAADQRQRIANARLVANPGCYPTGAIGLIRPLTKAGILPRDYPVTINAVSGYSGGGKQMIAQMEDDSHDDHIASPYFLYGLGLAHKHLPEIREHGLLTRTPVFSPSVGRFAQGMIVQVPLHLADLDGDPTPGDIHAALNAHYADQSVVTLIGEEQTRIVPRVDPTELNDTDNMRLMVFANEPAGLINLVAVLDNLGKGASGAAVQNMDIMLGNIAA